MSVAEFLVTAEGAIVQQLQQATIDADAFFDEPLYVVSITDWPSGEALLKDPVTASGSARISLWPADPADGRQIPSPGPEGVLFTTSTFSLKSSANMTLYAPNVPGRSMSSQVTMMIKSWAWRD